MRYSSYTTATGIVASARVATKENFSIHARGRFFSPFSILFERSYLDSETHFLLSSFLPSFSQWFFTFFLSLFLSFILSFILSLFLSFFLFSSSHVIFTTIFSLPLNCVCQGEKRRAPLIKYNALFYCLREIHQLN